MKQIKKSSLVALGLLIIFNFTGCDTAQKELSESKTAYYVDEAITNLFYSCGKYSGTTDEKGSFVFEAGEGCSFYLGNIFLRTIPSSVLEDEAYIIESDPTIIAFLQSFDNDNLKDQKIYITDDVVAVLQQNITSIPKTQEERENVVALVNQMLETNKYKAKTEEEAWQHLQQHIGFYTKKKHHFTSATTQETPPSQREQQEKKKVQLNQKEPSSPPTVDNKQQNSHNNESSSSASKDTTPPVITLKGKTIITLSKGDSYHEEGATARDNVDGDITKKIKIKGNVNTSKAGTYIILYSVSDSTGNTTTVKRTVKVIDATTDTPPTVTLIGPKEVYLTVGDKYIEYGAKAYDKEDGALSVEISKKSIDTSKELITTIKYTAYDSDGNGKYKRRLIVVKDAEKGKIKYPMTPLLSDAQKQEFLDAINTVRTHEQVCGDGTRMAAVDPLNWNEMLYTSAYAHAHDRDVHHLEGYPGWSGSGSPRDPVGFNKGVKSTYTQRIIGSGYAASVMAEVTDRYDGSISFLTILKDIIHDENKVRSCKDLMNPDLEDVGVSHDGEYFVVDMAAPLVRGEKITLRTYVAYDKSALDKYKTKAAIKTRANHIFSISNLIYKQSTLNLEVIPVGFSYYNTTDEVEDLHDALPIIKADTEFSYVDENGNHPDNLRNQTKAQTVLLFKAKESDSGLCGLAYIPTHTSMFDEGREASLAKTMFASVYANCFDRVVAHEMGHNFGLRHSHKQDGEDGIKPWNYAVGYGIEDQFVTIMAYKSAFTTSGGVVEKLKFSSPDYDCDPGVACGIKEGEAGEADAVSVMQVTLPAIGRIYQ